MDLPHRQIGGPSDVGFHCSICGGLEYTDHAVLWQELIDDWCLSADEVAYVNRQQGRCCRSCNANLRSIALADAILDVCGFGGLFREFVERKEARDLVLLEINEAGTLSPLLSRLPGHRLLTYPEHDMMHLAMADAVADLVVHSDTLEHVPDPVRGLAECRRVLKDGGAVCFTVPVVVGRLTRTRRGLKPSYHGDVEDSGLDMLVHTEFGADVFATVFAAGFSKVTMNAIDYPSAIALTAA